MKVSGKITAVILICALAIGSTNVIANYEQQYEPQEVQRDVSFAASRWTAPDGSGPIQEIALQKAKINGEEIRISDEGLFLKKDDFLTFDINIAKSGVYNLVLEYKPKNARVMDSMLTVKIDGMEYIASIPLLWGDAQYEYKKDAYGNELSPEQVSIEAYIRNPIIDHSRPGKPYLDLSLEEGFHTVELTSTVQDLVIKDISLVEKQSKKSYDEYMADIGEKGDSGEGLVIIEAEKYTAKSDPFIRGKGIKNPALYPYNTYKRLINTIDDNSWSQAGQKIIWEFEVEKDGFYNIAFRYSQYSEVSKTSFRTIEIDGRTPYTDLENVSFANTGLYEYKNYTLTSEDGKPLTVYLEKGRHTLAMRAEIGPLEECYFDLIETMDKISSVGMALKKLTAGTNDENRTWDMSVYLPEAVPELEKCAERIDAIYKKLWDIGGREPVYANNLVYAAETLRKLTKVPRTLPNKTNMLNEGDNSVNHTLGSVLSKLIKQPLSLDRIYIYNTKELPPDKVSFFRYAWESVKSFFHSFLPSAAADNYAATYEKNSKEVQVWINRPVQYVEVLQQIVDSDYNSKYGTNIRLSIMPNEQKLILANASGTNPDVVLGVNYWNIFDFAIRGAAKNLLEFDDFLEFYNGQYNLEALVPLCYNDNVYGAVETQDFYVLFYRKDILENLGLAVPDTWDDVKTMMPQLLQYSMNFNIPLANSLGFKPFSTTSPFIYQNKGDYYSDDGFSTAIDTENSIEGFTEMTEMFKIYAARQHVPNFYNSFRYGEVPIGIGNFSTYIQLQVAAPELTGLWDIAPVPGERQDDGSILRYQTADSTACMIFEDTKKADEAYRFLKWWLSKETQLKYAYTLQSTFGPEFRWNTANLEAFRELPYPEEHMKVILEQWENQKECPRHPAGYMVEREVSNVWNNVVANHKELIESIDKAALNSNREIIRKLSEFGFCDKDGNIIKDYSVQTIEKLRKKLGNERGSND